MCRWLPKVMLLRGAVLVGLLGGCAAPSGPAYAPPADGGPWAEVLLRLMPASGHRSAALYVRGTAQCNPSMWSAWLMPTIEQPAQLVAGSWQQPAGRVVKLPAATPLPLRFRYEGPGETYIVDRTVVLAAGARYVFEHEIPGRRFTLVSEGTGLPAPAGAVGEAPPGRERCTNPSGASGIRTPDLSSPSAAGAG